MTACAISIFQSLLKTQDTIARKQYEDEDEVDTDHGFKMAPVELPPLQSDTDSIQETYRMVGLRKLPSEPLVCGRIFSHVLLLCPDRSSANIKCLKKKFSENLIIFFIHHYRLGYLFFTGYHSSFREWESGNSQNPWRRND